MSRDQDDSTIASGTAAAVILRNGARRELDDRLLEELEQIRRAERDAERRTEGIRLY